MSNKTFWINAGEVSGDMQGAQLVKALKQKDPTARFVGMGGEYMQAAGLETLFRVEDLSVMGITEVIGHLPKIFRMLSAIKAALAREKPDALIVIDAPDFNFRVIKAAAELGIPVYYYISPKIWAWRQGRVQFIKRHVRRVISILPFEVDFYRRFDMDIAYVGNPLVDIIDLPSLDAITPDKNLIGFLPGSRIREVTSLLPSFGGAARILRQRLPHLSFVCLRAPNLDESLLRALWPDDVPVEFVEPQNRYEFMRRCRMQFAASGTVTLESALVGTPTVVAYRVSPLSFAVGKLLVKVPFISLPNLVMEREVFPELLQKQSEAVPLADAALRWLVAKPEKDPMAQVRSDMQEVRKRIGQPGAAGRAADVICADLAEIAAVAAAAEATAGEMPL